MQNVSEPYKTVQNISEHWKENVSEHWKESSEFKTAKLRLKIDLVLYPVRAEGLVNSIPNNSIKCQAFIYTKLKIKTVLFQTLHFSVCHFLRPV